MKTFSAFLALCAGNSSFTGKFPSQRPVARSFDIFFDLRLNKRLSKQSWGWWFETPSHHYAVIVIPHCMQCCFKMNHVMHYRIFRRMCFVAMYFSRKSFQRDRLTYNWIIVSGYTPQQYVTLGQYGKSWWRHQMETFNASLALCAGNSPVTGEFPSQRPLTQSFDIFCDLSPN